LARNAGALPDPSDDRALLDRAAAAAGQVALSYFRTDLKIVQKPDDQGPVTEADLAVNQVLLEELRGARPDYGWLSEESEDDARRLAARRVFIVDPIDGTRSFIDGQDGFSVAIAVVERGRVIAAAVDLPARQERFTAALGQGAAKNGAPLGLGAGPALGEATVLTARKQLDPQHWPGGVPPMQRHFRSSLAWRLCLVAEGRFDAMLTFRETFEWDVAAGALIAAEAGAAVTDAQGLAFRFNAPSGLQRGVIAAPAALHARIMAHRAPGGTGAAAPGGASD